MLADLSVVRKQHLLEAEILYCSCHPGEMLEDDLGKGMLGHSLNSCWYRQGSSQTFNGYSAVELGWQGPGKPWANYFFP